MELKKINWYDLPYTVEVVGELFMASRSLVREAVNWFQ